VKGRRRETKKKKIEDPGMGGRGERQPKGRTRGLGLSLEMRERGGKGELE
jgi:hypothetical protein